MKHCKKKKGKKVRIDDTVHLLYNTEGNSDEGLWENRLINLVHLQSSPTGPAEHWAGGSLDKSFSS